MNAGIAFQIRGVYVPGRAIRWLTKCFAVGSDCCDVGALVTAFATYTKPQPWIAGCDTFRQFGEC
ncbi:hypothetical protein ACVWWK_003787 [Bradyrhizobium sp. LB9.1b]